MRFVPKHCSPDPKLVESLASLLFHSNHTIVLTGAGISTESGLPDYRSQGVGLYARTNRRPIDYHSFITSEKVRQRYWTRNFVAWPYFSQVQPNQSHYLLCSWLKNGRISTIVTQNVDRLHQRAGSHAVLELHGNSHQVVCLNCGYRQSREELQTIISNLNPNWKDWESRVDQETVAPDGDIELPDNLVYSFHVPSCPSCNKGPLKPDVVFFGENLPSERKRQASKLVAEADLLLCCGTTLQTFSSYRLAIQAKEQGSSIAIVNIGPTRADPMADLIVNARITETLCSVDQIISSRTNLT